MNSGILWATLTFHILLTHYQEIEFKKLEFYKWQPLVFPHIPTSSSMMMVIVLMQLFVTLCPLDLLGVQPSVIMQLGDSRYYCPDVQMVSS